MSRIRDVRDHHPGQDLGDLEAPVLVFGGPYGNLQATEALLDVASRLGIPAARAICTGDLVAYASDPQGTVDRLRAWGCAVLMGNCEEALARDAADCGCGYSEDSACAALSVGWFAATRRDLDDETRRWMGTLPRRLSFGLAGRRLAVVHGAPSRINRFVFASTPANEKRSELDLAGTGGVVAGHSGLPFTQIVGGRLWHNAGAVGMPANDGTPRVWYSVLTPLDDAMAVAHHALAYDHASAARTMRARGYPAEYAEALVSGLWPSCDVLPPAEQAARGQPLSPPSVRWPRARARLAVG